MNINDSGVAEARDRLRERSQNEATCIALNDMLKDAQKEIVRLRIENIALRADADRIDWLADVENTVGSVVLPRHIVEQNIGSLRQAIDAARSAKTLPEPAP